MIPWVTRKLDKIILLDYENVRPERLKSDRKETSLKLDDFFEIHNEFIDFKVLEGLSSSTIDDHVRFMRFFREYVQSTLWSNKDQYAEINLFRSYIAYMVVEKEYKPCTVNLRLRTLKCYLKWLYDEGYVQKDTSTKVRLVKVPEDTIRPLSDDNVKRLLRQPDVSTYAGFKDYVIMLLILDCGIRIGEAVKLKIEDIDYDTGFINIAAENSKTKSYRQLPVGDKVIKLLKKLKLISIENDEKLIFLSTYGGGVQRGNVSANFRKYGKEANIDQRTTPYILRHTFASNTVKDGNMDIFTLQRIMGHSTIVTTRKYIQLNNEDLKKVHGRTDRLSKYL